MRHIDCRDRSTCLIFSSRIRKQFGESDDYVIDDNAIGGHGLLDPLLASRRRIWWRGFDLYRCETVGAMKAFTACSDLDSLPLATTNVSIYTFGGPAPARNTQRTE